MQPNAMRPHVSSIGFAIFVAINATQIWGGVFPFLPQSFQTDDVTILFYLAQSLAYFAAYVVSAIGAYFIPQATRRMLVGLVTALVFIGSSSVIAAMYVPPLTLELVVAGAVFLGVGCAGMYMLWQRCFASMSADEGNMRLALGTAAASIIYLSLHAVPIALTAFLVPIVMLPLCSLALTLSVREMEFDQAMFEDVPREHAQVYAHLLKDSWTSAAAIGALAFAAGLARGIAVLEGSPASTVNVASMIGALIAALALVAAWRLKSLRFSINSAYVTAYPFIAACLLVFPFMQNDAGLTLFAGLTHTAFTLAVMVMMMQCAQISRDRGINPVFIYGFFGSVAYGVQSVGFLLGWFARDLPVHSMKQVGFLSLLAMFVLGMVLFAATGLRRPSPVGQVEFINTDAFKRTARRTEWKMETTDEASGSGMPRAVSRGDGPLEESVADSRPGTSEKWRRDDNWGDRVITDRISKQCLVLQQEYGLSTRETEVCEAIARGLSMATIAERLFISENTVRTHSRHIYAKLDIHSRQELGAMLQEM
ncbi:helix-turn-helix transcriptional regulator [Slackia exigua]